MFMLSFGSGEDDDDDDQDQVVFNVDFLGFPSCYKVSPLYPRTHTILMVGSCNGLICLYDKILRVVSLWNPATRQFRILRKSITIQEKEIGIFPNDFVAFGLDVKTKDYKVVQITCFTPTCIAQWRPGCICRVQVYNLSTDSWRLLEGINSLPARPSMERLCNNGLYLNGCYFFVGIKFPSKLPSSFEEDCAEQEKGNNNLMISFDFTIEIFTTMQCPDHDNTHELVLCYLGEKIALVTTQYSFSEDDYENYDIWVLNEQGGDVNKESWTKLHSFRLRKRGASWILPRGILNNEKFALVESKTYYRKGVFYKLHLLNLVTKEAKRNFTICDRVLKVDVYKQSLVSIIGGDGAAAAN